MHPYLTVPSALLDSLGVPVATPITALPLMGQPVRLTLPDLSVGISSARKVRVSWTADGETVSFPVTLKGSTGVQRVEQNLSFGGRYVRVAFLVTVEKSPSVSVQVKAEVPGIYAQALAILPREVWSGVRPALTLLPRCHEAIRAVPLPGQADLNITVSPAEIEQLVRVNEVSAHVHADGASLACRVSVDGLPVFLVSLDGGRAWTSHTGAKGLGVLTGLPDHEVRHLRARLTPRRALETVVSFDRDAQEWVLRDAAEGERRYPALGHEGVATWLAEVETLDGLPAGER